MIVAICDDNLSDAKELSAILQKSQDADKITCDLFDNSERLLAELIKKPPYDLLLLDIDMPGMNGIELAKKIKSVNAKAILIFATAHPRYMIDAFDVEAFHYILKPFDSEKVLTVFQKAYQKYASMNRYHSIKIKTQTIRLKMDDIYFIEHCQKHVVYHTRKNDYEVIETLSSVYNTLRDFGFYQIHQGYIVNMDKIDHFNRYSVVLTDGRSVAISVRKKSEVIAAYTRYIRG